ncbi:MAG: pyridoxal phosphate-dependent aminotransferase [Candidatus Wolfebacteria bacterium]|nr:pyridoxal phosphate-dependent aminotransferase [Candidatus Wolfebacteria bacterium]
MKELSSASKNLTGQPMFEFLSEIKEAERKGKRVIHFEIGDPSFDTPKEITRAAKESLERGETHYTDSMGIRDLREEIAKHVASKLGYRPELEQVLVKPANAIVDFVVRCIADPGDEVIYPDPGFPTYHSVVKYAGMKGVPISLKEKHELRMDPEDVQRNITEKTKLIIVNSPSNPTGAMMTEEESKRFADIAREHGTYLLSDETYAELVYDKIHYSPSVYDECGEYTITLNSFSKAYDMSGWRLGYAIGPKEVIKKMGLMLQTIVSCLPEFIQRGGIAALRLDENHLMSKMKELRKRRKAITEGLNSIRGVRCLEPEGAFYVFPNVEGTGKTSKEFARIMFEEAGVAVLPGSDFGAGGEGFARLSFVSRTEDQIKEAIQAMKRVV